MKERWQQLSRKFNALMPRERIMVLSAMIVAVAGIFYFLALDPLLTQKQRLTREVNEVRTTLKTAENTLKLQKTQADPDVARRSYRDSLRKQVAELDKSMKGLQKELVPPDQMAKLLEGMLSRNRGLQLVGLRKLPMQRFEVPGAGPAAPKPDTAATAAGKAAAQSERGIYQHGFELIVQGTYVDLHDYLARLEKLPWRMFWGRINMDADKYPRLTVTLTVHTLSLDKAWLIV